MQMHKASHDTGYHLLRMIIFLVRKYSEILGTVKIFSALPSGAQCSSLVPPGFIPGAPWVHPWCPLGSFLVFSGCLLFILGALWCPIV